MLVHVVGCEKRPELVCKLECTWRTFYDMVFVTGNKDTLMTEPAAKGIDVRERLLEFHSQYYSSNIMGLAVVGKGWCIYWLCVCGVFVCRIFNVHICDFFACVFTHG